MTKILCAVFGGLILLNTAVAVPQIIERVQVLRTLAAEQDQQPDQVVQAGSDMPNVYLLIFDEYANFPQMEEHYDYDNAPLRDVLSEHNFNVSYTSHNESILSATIQANMMSLDYVVDDSNSTGERTYLRHNVRLF